MSRLLNLVVMPCLDLHEEVNWVLTDLWLARAAAVSSPRGPPSQSLVVTVLCLRATPNL